MAFKMTGDEPMAQPPAFFDLQGANTIAGAVGGRFIDAGEQLRRREDGSRAP